MNETKIPRMNFFASLALMKQNGVPIRTIIDIGCADGSFSLQYMQFFGKDVIIVNIDAQSVYEESLKKIQKKMGGYYKITGISAYNGQMRFSVGKHPYWLEAEGDTTVRIDIESRTIDSIVEEFSLTGPYLIKMDIEGAEFAALQGAVKTLNQTTALILETNIYYGPDRSGNFLDIYNFLGVRNFSLFDITSISHRNPDLILNQIYTVFLNKNYEFRHRYSKEEKDKEHDRLKGAMDDRRKMLLELNEQLLNTL